MTGVALVQKLWGGPAAGGGAACLHARESAELSPPSSPRLRQTTFGATLDFIEALCDASSGLTAFAPVRSSVASNGQMLCAWLQLGADLLRVQGPS